MKKLNDCYKIKSKHLAFRNEKNLFHKFLNKNFNDFDVSKDYYKILGINSNSDEKEIKLTYYKLAKKHHPDINNGKTTDAFKEMSAAYDILSDPKKRKKYDEYKTTFSSTSEPNNNNEYEHNPFRESKNYENFFYRSVKNHKDDFKKQYTKAKTTYYYRDPMTGEQKSYTFEQDKHSNPFYKDFDDIFKQFNRNWGNKNVHNQKSDEFNDSSFNSRFKNKNYKDNFSDPYNEYKSKENNPNSDQRQNWHPNWTDYDYYNYLYARKLFLYILIGSLMVLIFIEYSRVRYRYIEDPYIYQQNIPYPPNNHTGSHHDYYRNNQQKNGIIQPNYNHNPIPNPQNLNINRNSQYEDPYTSTAHPKLR